MIDDIDIVDELEVDVVRGRSTFLTVLCILTWVGSGLSIFYHLYVYFIAANIANIAAAFGDHKSFDWLLLFGLVGMLAPLFTIGGSVLMWNLKKPGFFVYAFGQIVPIVLSFYFALAVMDKTGGGIFVFAILPNIIPVGFLVMYGTRLHEMKK